MVTVSSTVTQDAVPAQICQISLTLLAPEPSRTRAHDPSRAAGADAG